ncbi:hypothetical protein SAMD00019534_059390 [Acytostelium subglobosum LB1]|uniref:hypothetical protein n=1 Tax=Acytostelium subglobosum LB1 TaxID=1410327 RepID=UPI0006452154|nr:hypothetical protein SAMD00019534_059390 [Acytostelium subglobosum LB1]GAM22764.1 hypothetical protein SAMD00019534_059390 [Acytostelium subglobosum LB1]|eukprot:XP_012753991.1 hypothetical protein SAMD00019534_059390 [Acytostelium subglobosum LB1]
MVMKKGPYVLWVHDQQFSKEELVVNPEHFPRLRVNDIVEIASPNNPTKRLCLRVKQLAPVKGALQISVAKYIASVFDFASSAGRREVIVNIIPEKAAIIDYVQVSFKDQYIGRSDMWRLKLSLQNECVYVFKKLAFAQVRAQVEEMVAGGQKVSSGLIVESTKFVFRSRSAKFILLIQMSKEMWDFADDGDLYFEKAVNGFLKSLFARWRALAVNHTITIILFSRTYFDSPEILDEIPDIPRNARGQLFQDFYKVVVSDETRQDWSSIIVNLKREFGNYHAMVNWDIYGRNSALGKNSTASQGNFLEAINLGMSYFDKHYIDRDFTRTGQMIVVVSPGTGIFEVEPDINLLTKQRMIDNGYGCDLVCLNRHPLHLVPLFKYSNIDPKKQSASADPKSTTLFNIPYWVAVSFYNDNKPTNGEENNTGERFTPQFRIPDPPPSYDQQEAKPVYDFYVPKDPRKLPAFASQQPPNKYTSHTLGVNSYEDTIFNIPEKVMSGDMNQPSAEILDDYMQTDTDASELSDDENHSMRKRNSVSFGRPSTSHGDKIAFIAGKKNQSYSTSFEQKKLTGPQLLVGSRGRSSTMHHSMSPLQQVQQQNLQKTINPFKLDSTSFHLTSNRRRWSHLWYSPNTFIFGKTNANLFLPNWKSLCEPASLPITTDYFPTPKDLLTKYIEYVHTLTLSPDENEYHNNTEELLKELISQRLAQGYQLIMTENHNPNQPTPPPPTNRPSRKAYQLSLGHDFHVITYDPGNLSIQVKRYQRHSGRDLPNSIQYTYFLCTAYHQEFITQNTILTHQASGSYPWNSLDNLICGAISEIKTTLRYWRVQFAIIPLPKSNNDSNSAANALTNDASNNGGNNNNTSNSSGSKQHSNEGSSTTTSAVSPNLQSPSLSPPNSSVLANIINTTATVTTSQQHTLQSISAPTSPVSVKNNMMTNTSKLPLSQLTPLYNVKPSASSSSTTSPTTSQEMAQVPIGGGGGANNYSENFNAPEHTEEERIASFTKFKEFINSMIAKNQSTTLAAANAPGGNSAHNKMEVYVINNQQLSTLEGVLEIPSQPLLSDLSISQQEYSVKEKLAPIDINGIFNRLNMPPPIGLKMVVKKHRLRTYRKCFVGSELIDWLMQNVDVISREESTNLALVMVDQKYVKAVEKNQFVDGFHYYRLKDDTTTPLTNNNNNNTSAATANKKEAPTPPTLSQTKLPTHGSSSNLQSIEHNFDAANNNGGSSNNFANINNNTNNNNNVYILNSSQQAISPIPTPSTQQTNKNNNNNSSALSPSDSPNYSPKMSRDRYALSSSYMEPVASPSTLTESMRGSNGGVQVGQLSSTFGGQYMFSNQALLTQTAPSANNIQDVYENPNHTEEQKIDMDPTKTDRYEWIMMKYDKSFTPSRYYHIEFKWMVCTGCVVDEFVSNCIRKAKTYGLTLIQVPLEKNYSPFYAPTHIKLSPKLRQPEIVKVILSQFNFVPDLLRKRATSLVTRNDLYLFSDSDVFYTEYIHRTGMLFVRVVEDGFTCIINNGPSNRQFLPAALICMKGFQDLVAQLNSSMPSIIYQTSDWPAISLEEQDTSPQSSLLRSLPPQEANFLSLFAQGYTADISSDNEQQQQQANGTTVNSAGNNNNVVGSGSGNNNEKLDNSSSSDTHHDDSDNEHTFQDPQAEAMWESNEILYYSLMSKSPTI